MNVRRGLTFVGGGGGGVNVRRGLTFVGGGEGGGM